MIADHSRLFQTFKYIVYALLTINIYLFFTEEWAASAHRFADDILLEDIIEGFASSIDTAAWVVLLLLFELETCVLSDKHFTPRLTFALHGLRMLCFSFIIYAFYGYVIKLVFLFGAIPLPGVTDLCALVDGVWAYAVDLDKYEVLSLANCGSLSTADSLLQLGNIAAVVDQPGLRDIVRLAWADVINSGAWLLVVMVLEIDVRLQDRSLLTGTLLHFSRASKLVLYSTLLCAAIYWGLKGTFIDFWDAFLWLVAFVFIELNIFEWKREPTT